MRGLLPMVVMLLFAAGTVLSQTQSEKEIDSLQQALKRTQPDTTKVNTLSALCYRYAYMDPGRGVEFGAQSLELATRVAWEKGVAYAHSMLAICFLNQSDFAKAMEHNKTALAIYERLKNEQKTSMVYNNIGMVYLAQSDHQNALDYFQKALDINERIGDKPGSAYQIANMGIIYSDQGDYAKSLEYFFKALKLYEETGNKIQVAALTMNIGTNYHSQGDFKSAEGYFARALKLEEEDGNKNGIASAYLNISANYGDMKKYSLALEYGLKALNMHEALGDKASMAIGFGNLGDYYRALGRYQESIEYNMKAVQIAKEIGTPTSGAWALEHLGATYLEMADDSVQKADVMARQTGRQTCLQKSIQFFRDGLTLGIERKDLLLQRNCYKGLTKAYRLTGDFEKAMEASANYYAIHDTLVNIDKENKIDSIVFNYELEKKQSRIALLEKDKQLNAVKLKQQVWLRNGIIVGALLMIGLIVALLLARMQHNTKRMQVAFTQSLITSQEAERQRISRELHDSIGQNILFVKNHLTAQSSPALQPAIETIALTIEEVRNISKNLYPNQLEKYGLAAAVDTLAEKAHEATGMFVSADLHEIQDKVWKAAEINLYRIVQEALNNVIKHAGAAAVRIEGRMVNGNIELTIKDNGKGFDASILERKAQRSYGVLNMEERAKMLRGTLTIESNSGGTVITVSIPTSHAV